MSNKKPLTSGVVRMRMIAGFVFLSLIAYSVITEHMEITTFGTLVGALLITLGYEVGLRVPGGILSDGKPEEDDENDPH